MFMFFILILQDEKFVLAYIDYLSHLNGESRDFLGCINSFFVWKTHRCVKTFFFFLSRAKIPPPKGAVDSQSSFVFLSSRESGNPIAAKGKKTLLA